MEPTFFATPEEFRAWLEEHHETEAELLVGFHNKGSGRPSITWPQSVDQALCFGWIDGVRRRIDDASSSIRFTPRTQRSTWSVVNVRRVGELSELGLMRPAGIAAFERRSDDRTATYWVISAKRPETRERRLQQLIADSAAGRTIRSLTPPARRGASGAGPG